MAIQIVREATGEPRVRIELGRRDGDDAPLVLDASTRSGAHPAPFVSPPWRVMYRSTRLEFGEFATAGWEVVHRLAERFPSDPWSSRAAGSTEFLSPTGVRTRWFVSEATLLDGLESQSPESMRERIATRIDAASGTGIPAVLLYLRGACAQRCVFCTVPHERDAHQPFERRTSSELVASGAFDALVRELERREGSSLTLLGDDWSSHSEIDALLERLTSTRVTSSLLGPGTALASPELARRVAAIPHLEHVTVTLQASPDTESGRAMHDSVVGRSGAAANVADGVARLRELGVSVKVACVVTRASIGALPELAEWCAHRGLPLAITGSIPDRTRATTFHPEEHIARADVTHEALDRARRLGGEAIERVVGLPLCAIPTELQAKASARWDSADAEPSTKPVAPCDGCAAASACSGVPVAYVRAHGSAGLAQVAAASRR